MKYEFEALAHVRKLQSEHNTIRQNLADAQAARRQAESVLSDVLMDDTATQKQIDAARKVLPEAIRQVDMLEHESESYKMAIDASLQKAKAATESEFMHHFNDLVERLENAITPLPDTMPLSEVVARSTTLSAIWQDYNNLRRAWSNCYRNAIANPVDLQPYRKASGAIQALAQAVRDYQSHLACQERLNELKQAPEPEPPTAKVEPAQPKPVRVSRQGTHNMLVIGQDI